MKKDIYNNARVQMASEDILMTEENIDMNS